MEIIDQKNWPRKEHFDFFSRMESPSYNISFPLDVTHFYRVIKSKGLSFYYSMIHLSIQAANQVENLRYRIRGNEVVLHEGLHPSFADLGPDSELFKLVTLDFHPDLGTFNRLAKEQSQSQQEYFPLEKLKGRDEFIYFSSIPWISFTSIDHTANGNKDDAVPRISWGKYYWEGDRCLLPYNLQVHHAFVDGLHLGMFKEALDSAMESLK